LRRRVLLAAALVAASLVVAACGDEKTDTYNAEGEKVVDRFQKDLRAAQAELQNQTEPEGVARGIEQMRSAFAEAADGLSRLDPPGDAKADHDKFVGQLRAFGPELDRFAKAVREQDSETIGEVQAVFTTRLKELQATADTLKGRLQE